VGELWIPWDKPADIPHRGFGLRQYAWNAQASPCILTNLSKLHQKVSKHKLILQPDFASDSIKKIFGPAEITQMPPNLTQGWGRRGRFSAGGG
jgi:hypothetical protein